MENDVNTGPQIEDRVQEFHLGSEDGPRKKVTQCISLLKEYVRCICMVICILSIKGLFVCKNFESSCLGESGILQMLSPKWNSKHWKYSRAFRKLEF